MTMRNCKIHLLLVLVTLIAALCAPVACTAQQKKQEISQGASKDLKAPLAEGPSEDLHRRIHSILSSPEYQSRAENESDLSKQLRKNVDQLRTTVDRIKKWLQETWNRVMRLFSGARGIKGSGNVYIILFLILFAAVIAWFLYRYYRQYKNAPRKQLKTVASETVLEHELLIEALSKSPEQWFELANQQATVKNYRDAVRCLFLRILCLMDRQGTLEFVPSETNRTIIGLVNNRTPQGAQQFSAMVGLYEMAWYGQLETTETAYRAMLTASEALETVVNTSFREASHA